MFSVNIKYADNTESLLHAEVIDWEPAGPVAGTLILDDTEYPLTDQDVAFVANFRGQTIRIYGKKPPRRDG